MLTARLYAWTRAHPGLVDAALALVILLTFGLVSFETGKTVGGAFGIAAIALLVVRRRWPVAVMSAMVVLSLVQVVLVDALLPANVAQLFVVYTVAAHVRAFRTRLVALGFGLLGSILAALRVNGVSDLARSGFSAFVFAVAVTLVWLVGNVIRGRESIIEQLSESNRLLERDREQRDLIAAQDERARIAREMHDIVAHSLSVVVVQADGGAYAAEHADRWGRADAASTLETIGSTARSALAETRRLVGVLREDGAAADLSPLSGLADLDSLLDGVRSSGLRVTTDLTGLDLASPMPRTIDLAAYRVIQESLTNVLKHAGPGATAHVDVRRLAHAVRVTVTDDGLGASASDDGEGNGVAGMRERVSASGGTLVAGARAEGGFAVVATLPVDGLAMPAPGTSVGATVWSASR